MTIISFSHLGFQITKIIFLLLISVNKQAAKIWLVNVEAVVHYGLKR